MSPAPGALHTVDYSAWSADDTIAAIRNQTITTRQYITRVLHRAHQVKPFNVFITLLPDEALSAADKIDHAIAREESLPPLAGLAIVAKDNINLAGHPTTAGTAALLHNRPPTTAPSLEKLIAAGAIVIGKTNLHELSYGATSTNLQPFANPVHNPYSFDRIPGGSSGGTAVAIATRVVTCGLATDTGGSARIPAALTGVAGYRPSVGDGGSQRRYHDEGSVVPISHTRDTIGLMGRTVADITLLDSIISGRPRAQPAQLSGLRLGVPPILWSGLDKELEVTVLRARQDLKRAGVVLIEDDLPNLFQLDSTVGGVVAAHETRIDLPAYLEASNVKNVDLQGIFDGIISPDVKTIFGPILDDTAGALYEGVMKVHRPSLQKVYSNYFSTKGVEAILFPTTFLPATLIEAHGSGNLSINGGQSTEVFKPFIRNTSPGSNAGIPGLSIPVGMTSSGLPVGIAIDGPPGSDERLFALGLAMEKVFGHLPPPQLQSFDHLSETST